MEAQYEALKLKNQICFPLYACAKEVVKAYKPYLDELNLTYTQYITMMVMWEHRSLRVKEVGAYLYLDSSTLTPLLKKLEEKGYVLRKRSDKDERDVIVTITARGIALQAHAAAIPEKLSACIGMPPEKAHTLYLLLHELLRTLTQPDANLPTERQL